MVYLPGRYRKPMIKFITSIMNLIDMLKRSYSKDEVTIECALFYFIYFKKKNRKTFQSIIISLSE
jgi:hypothetical protein